MIDGLDLLTGLSTLFACTLCAVLLVPDDVGGVFQLARVQSRASKDAERISRNGDPVAPSPFQDSRVHWHRRPGPAALPRSWREDQHRVRRQMRSGSRPLGGGSEVAAADRVTHAGCHRDIRRGHNAALRNIAHSLPPVSADARTPCSGETFVRSWTVSALLPLPSRWPRRIMELTHPLREPPCGHTPRSVILSRFEHLSVHRRRIRAA